MYSFESVQIDYTKKQLEEALKSKNFEMAAHALAERNPYFARHFVRLTDPVQMVHQLCVVAILADIEFEYFIKETYGLTFDEYKTELADIVEEDKKAFMASYILDDEPLALDYNSLIHIMEDTHINVTPEQEEKLKEQLSPLTDEEYKDFLRKCRQAPEIFGWQTMKHKPLCKGY